MAACRFGGADRPSAISRSRSRPRLGMGWFGVRAPTGMRGVAAGKARRFTLGAMFSDLVNLLSGRSRG